MPFSDLPSKLKWLANKPAGYCVVASAAPRSQRVVGLQLMMDCDKAIPSPIIVDLSNGHAGHDGDSSIGGDGSASSVAGGGGGNGGKPMERCGDHCSGARSDQSWSLTSAGTRAQLRMKQVARRQKERRSRRLWVTHGHGVAK